MAYASLPDVNALAAKRTFGATSIPSASQVAVYLDFAAAEIDTLLGADGYQVPVPTAASIALLYLRRVNAIGAYVQVEHAAQVSKDVDKASALWEAEKKKLISGDAQLIDAPRLGGENFARAQSAATPYFTRDMAL